MTQPGYVPFWTDECSHFDCHAPVKYIAMLDVRVCARWGEPHVYLSEDVTALADMSKWVRNTLRGYKTFRKQTILLQAPILVRERVLRCVNSGT